MLTFITSVNYINKCDQLMCQAQIGYSPLEPLECYIVCVLFDNSTESIKYIPGPASFGEKEVMGGAALLLSIEVCNSISTTGMQPRP